MPENLKTFPTEAIPGKWRWVMEGESESESEVGYFCTCTKTETETRSDGLMGFSKSETFVLFVFAPPDGFIVAGLFDPDSDHFERVDDIEDEVIAALAPHEIASTPVVAHRAPTPEEIDACADPVELVERVTGRKWVESVNGRVWLLRRGPGLQPYAMVDAPAGHGWSWQVWHSHKVGIWPNAEGGAAQVGVALHGASLALLHALAEGRAEMPEGAPGLSVGERAALGVAE